AYVFIANHQSTLDPPLLFAYLRWNVGALAKKELSRVPILGQGMSLGHVIPIDRGNHERALASTRLGAQTLKDGHSLMAFPEGTRTVDGKVKEFKKGVFFMAIDAGVPIVPVVINDTRLVMRKGMQSSIPGDVWVEVLSPLPTEGYSRTNIEDLVARVRDTIASRVRHD
ncbi:MAG: lysophospholipid acyltransferase family protein, partial [Acidobacteriota bacterium]